MGFLNIFMLRVDLYYSKRQGKHAHSCGNGMNPDEIEKGAEVWFELKNPPSEFKKSVLSRPDDFILCEGHVSGLVYSSSNGDGSQHIGGLEINVSRIGEREVNIVGKYSLEEFKHLWYKGLVE